MTELADKVMDTTADIAGDVEDKLAVIGKSLREASVSALELSEEASAALSNAAAQVVKVAEALRKNSAEVTSKFARRAGHEIQDHPFASIAIALGALSALFGVISAARGTGKGHYNAK